MNDFIMHYGVCVLLCAIGLFFVIVTYASYFTKPSGTPLIGGIFIALGFLTTPYKWLALLGFIDPGYFSLVYFLIHDHICEKKFEAVYAKHDFIEGERNDSKSMRIYIPDREEKLIHPYITRHIYYLNIPKLLFSVCIDKVGNRYILVDKCIKGGHIEMLEFDEGYIVLSGKTSKNVEMTVEVEIVKD